jgi:L-threonylcarbamoyladenylate synthase
MQIFTSLNDPKVVKLLRSGAVGVLPSDTVYGLMAVAANEQAVQRVYRLKQRKDRPGTVVAAANVAQLADLGLKERYLKAVQNYWPGAISVLIPHSEPSYLTDPDSKAVAVRIPDYPEFKKLLEQTGALQTSSANLTGQPVANTVAEAQAVFGDQVDFYVDGGDLSGKPPSTVIRIVDDAIEVLREGAVKIDENGRISK